MEELAETTISLHCGDATYLSRSKKDLAEFASRDGSIDYSTLDPDLIPDLYQVGEWWREDRRELPGVARLLESVRGGVVGYVPYWWDRGFYLECGERMGDMKPVVQTAGHLLSKMGGKEAPRTKRYDRQEDVLADIRIYGQEYDVARLPRNLLGYVPHVERDILQTIAHGATRLGETLNFIAANVETGESTHLVSEVDAELEDVAIIFCPRAVQFPPGLRLPAPQRGRQDAMHGEIPQSVMILTHLMRAFPDKVSRTAWVAWADDLSDLTRGELESLTFGTNKTKFFAGRSRIPVFIFGSRAAIEKIRAATR